jgi:ATP-dependent helicase/nuclease subunit A
VSANAGAGKTYLLTDRVTRLLLSGASPARILCLTYTKAAAAEMATRRFDRLGA